MLYEDEIRKITSFCYPVIIAKNAFDLESKLKYHSKQSLDKNIYINRASYLWMFNNPRCVKVLKDNRLEVITIKDIGCDNKIIKFKKKTNY